LKKVWSATSALSQTSETLVAETPRSPNSSDAAERIRWRVSRRRRLLVPVSLLYQEARLVSTRLRVFLDWMREHLRARPVLTDLAEPRAR
jgi:hypothetical protein